MLVLSLRRRAQCRRRHGGRIDVPTDTRPAAAFMICTPIRYCPEVLRWVGVAPRGRPWPDLFPRRYRSVPGMLAVRLLVVSVRTMSVNETVIGGLHSGWNVAVATSV